MTMQPRLNDASTPAGDVSAWLRSAGTRSLDEAGLIASLGRHLHHAGAGFDRVTFHIGTLHPDVFARILAFTPGEPVEVFEQDHPATVAAGFPESPFRQAASLRKKLVVRGADPQFLGRAGGHLLQSRGLGELVCAPFSDRNGRTVILSFCTARPTIFSAADHQIIDRVMVSLLTAHARTPRLPGKTAIRRL
jgi:adenylate cyclase